MSQKPIRFVTNHDGPYAKRRRINSACLTCRRKKTRCSGERPECGTCIQNKHDCAGYGDDSTQDATRQGNKAVPKATHGSSNPPVFKVEQPIDPHLTRPPLSHTVSTMAQSPGSTLNPTPRRDDNAGSNGLSLSTRNRMPYFRYFGPTAIMPGFKQMVVKVRGKQHGSGQTTSDQHPLESSPAQPSVGSPPIPEARTPLEIPVYDASTMSPSPLITHLCKLFFVHLGCSFPFLQRDRFMRDLEEKQVDAILVDAVCALAARFSTHPMLTGNGDQPKPKDGEGAVSKLQPSEYGQAFALRAKSAIPDAFPCPSVAVVQAALLLAYDEFGASRDSGLWMYLGIAIRMAQDLGMQTLQGLKYEGHDGPTPKSVKADTESRRPSLVERTPRDEPETGPEEQEQRAVERERLDTFWSIFFLDRVISSGTGRPVTLHDSDIELSFPSLDEVDTSSGWPLPFPALIRIIHLYGRVTDLLNRIRYATDITDDLQKQLGALEDRLTIIYQNLSPKLHFNAVNFQQYVKFNQGANFLLLHCWFHTLIVLLHQPTLLKTFEGTPQSLAANSRELSMSSAKTVADILAFTELIDAKTGMGSPFTSQPIYIAACAFLKETAIHSASSQPQSRPATPDSTAEIERKKISMPNSINNQRHNHAQDREQKQAAKHTLLASAANQNYQRCYRSLKALETYWAGVKYILTVLDQKVTGVGDPLLYTREEMESALEVPRPEPSFTSPGWRRKLSWGTYLTAQSPDGEAAKLAAAIRKGARTPTIPGSPMVHPSQAIGWSLTGTMNSPSTHVAVMYSSENNNGGEAKVAQSKPSPASNQPSIASLMAEPAINFEQAQALPSPSNFQHFNPTTMPPPPNQVFGSVPSPDPVLVSDADLLLNLHSPFSGASPSATRTPIPTTSYTRSTSIQQQPPPPPPPPPPPIQNDLSPTLGAYATASQTAYGDMVIDTQDVDMSVLGADMMPWDLEYLPHEILYFGDGTFAPDTLDGAATTGGAPPR
ncbi:pathway-specific nitrogen regulator [Cucurbitaria berberidis CBS 394.84]|uniref:Pathway-specific nitrogen regulator n=1 Tax=Cucurbitaria berberidis CBS 394.84 TaxID=1168544 RepID=A0A9P4GFX9_9PLEO|nr:pathway-specific nitrogen regulator [Cucurbitaria berberidis CBS 394.84]KAF1844450.1 pathway-specific nitrogen regulator [Cucurbitaria berberidis CBS 394.84]